MPVDRNQRHQEPNGQDTWRIFRIMAEFVEGFEVMSPVKRGVSIFGSARTRPDDPYYKAAEKTAQLLAKAGYAVVRTDYEGLGTPGDHPYLVGVSEGRSVLDMALYPGDPLTPNAPSEQGTKRIALAPTHLQLSSTL